jgi:hypothetical protein
MFSIDRQVPRSYSARPACAEVEIMAKPINEDESVAIAIEPVGAGRKALGPGTKGICTETIPAGL